MAQKIDTSAVFPYSSDEVIKRQQVWDNMQKGILLENKGVLIPWMLPVSDLDKYAEQRLDRGDRTEWFLGKHQILDGYTCSIGVMKWEFGENTKPFSEIEEWLGFDDEGNEKFLALTHKLTHLLGEPSSSELEKFGDLTLGSIEWTNRKVKVRLSGIEQFACKYRMSIAVTDIPNEI